MTNDRKTYYLKPCPFCGCSAEMNYEKDIICTGCGATIGFRTSREEMINDWNRRMKE